MSDEGNKDSHSPVRKAQVIRMIDTDNEDVDVSNDSSEPIRLDKLDEEEKLDTSMNTYEKSLHPPSFKTAIKSRPLFNGNISNSNIYTQGQLHPYQNDIDLNIHANTALPKIVQYESQQ